MGAPNIVTTDEDRREVWIYDKIATEAAYSTSSGGLSSLIVGVGDLVRANAQFKAYPTLGAKAVDDPAPYQDFFTALEKSMFLTAQQVD